MLWVVETTTSASTSGPGWWADSRPFVLLRRSLQDVWSSCNWDGGGYLGEIGGQERLESVVESMSFVADNEWPYWTDRNDPRDTPRGVQLRRENAGDSSRLGVERDGETTLILAGIESVAFLGRTAYYHLTLKFYLHSR